MTDRLRLPDGVSLQDLVLSGGYAAARNALPHSTGTGPQYRLLAARTLTSASLLGILPGVTHKVLTVEQNLSRGQRAGTGHRPATLNLDTALNAVRSAEQLIANESAWRSEADARQHAVEVLCASEEVSAYHHLWHDLPEAPAQQVADAIGAAGFAVDAGVHAQLITDAERLIDERRAEVGIPGGLLALPARGGVIEARLTAPLLSAGAEHAAANVASAVLMPFIARFCAARTLDAAQVEDLNWSGAHGQGNLSVRRGQILVQFQQAFPSTTVRVSALPISIPDAERLSEELHVRQCLRCQTDPSCPNRPRAS